MTKNSLFFIYIAFSSKKCNLLFGSQILAQFIFRYTRKLGQILVPFESFCYLASEVYPSLSMALSPNVFPAC